MKAQFIEVRRLIDEVGLTQYGMIDERGCMCLDGAIGWAYGARPIDSEEQGVAEREFWLCISPGGSGYEAARHVACVIAGYTIAAGSNLVSFVIYQFNDGLKTIKADVLAVLDRAIETCPDDVMETV